MLDLDDTSALPRRVSGQTSRERSKAARLTMARWRAIASWSSGWVFLGRPLKTSCAPGLRAVCMGINPSRVSVEAGHYHQGRLGRLFLRRLRGVELLTRDAPGYEDDVLFAEGVGFTDTIKRATARARELRPDELAHGRGQLLRKLNEGRRAARHLHVQEDCRSAVRGLAWSGASPRPGRPPRQRLRHARPYAPRGRVEDTLDELRALLD
jgi:G:T/U-mismatch repair DNA glycosylase